MRAVVVAVLAVVLSVGGAGAGAADERLDILFARLAAAESDVAAATAEALIWVLWFDTDNPAAARSVNEALDSSAKGDRLSAIAWLDDAIAADPDFAEAWNKRATLYYLEGDFAQSIADIQRVLTLEPRHFGALAGLGLIYDQLGEERAALSAYRAAAAIHPRMPRVRERIAALSQRLEGQPL